MRVVLIYPPHVFESTAEDQLKIRTPVFPLGLGYIAKALIDKGHSVEIFEINANSYTKEEVIEKIKKLEYDVVGISALCTQYKYVKWLSARLKEHSQNPIIIGGALATYSSKPLLENSEVDICVLGEGDITITDLLNNLNNLKRVRGIAFKDHTGVIKTEPRELINNLDSVGFPAWDLFPLEIYFKYSKVGQNYNIRTISLISSRGCPYNCNFCAREYRGMRFRSVNNVIAEIKEYINKYNIKGVHFNDNLCFANKQRALELCEKLKPLKLKWACDGRANLVYNEVLKAAKSAGCVLIGYGIESGSQTILDNMNKQTTFEQNKRAIKATLKAGILPGVPMMYGYPGETKETIQETVRLFKEADFFSKGASITTALPGTKLYDDCIKKGLIKDEDAYLKKLERGIAGGEKFIINFTDFSEEEFYKYKNEMEKTIQFNYLKRHPVLFAKHAAYLFKLYSMKYGPVKTISKLFKEIGNHAKFILRNSS